MARLVNCVIQLSAVLLCERVIRGKPHQENGGDYDPCSTHLAPAHLGVLAVWFLGRAGSDYDEEDPGNNHGLGGLVAGEVEAVEASVTRMEE